MITFEEIKNDKYIIDIYKQIDINELQQWAIHGMKHINKVVNVVEYILTKLGYNEEIIQCGKIAALLHDIGCVQGKKDHAINGYSMAKEYLKDKDLSEEYKEIILDAIIDHSNGNNIKNIIGASLVIADKLDFDKNRMTPFGLDIEHFKQLQYIEKVDIDIDNYNFNVDFKVTDEFDKQDMEQYYFVEKIFKAVDKFAKYINRNGKITLNAKEWII